MKGRFPPAFFLLCPLSYWATCRTRQNRHPGEGRGPEIPEKSGSRPPPGWRKGTFASGTIVSQLFH